MWWSTAVEARKYILHFITVYSHEMQQSAKTLCVMEMLDLTDMLWFGKEGIRFDYIWSQALPHSVLTYSFLCCEI